MTKVVVRPFGIENHTIAFVLAADWKDLVNLGHFKNTTVGRSLMIVPRGGRLTLRTWAKPLRDIVIHEPKDVKILVSQFRASNGHSFEENVLVNVPRQGESTTALEPL